MSTTVYVLCTATDGQPSSYYPFTLERGNATPPWGYRGYDRMAATNAVDALAEFKTLEAAYHAARQA